MQKVLTLWLGYMYTCSTDTLHMLPMYLMLHDISSVCPCLPEPFPSWGIFIISEVVRTVPGQMPTLAQLATMVDSTPPVDVSVGLYVVGLRSSSTLWYAIRVMEPTLKTWVVIRPARAFAALPVCCAWENVLQNYCVYQGTEIPTFKVFYPPWDWQGPRLATANGDLSCGVPAEHGRVVSPTVRSYCLVNPWSNSIFSDTFGASVVSSKQG